MITRRTLLGGLAATASPFNAKAKPIGLPIGLQLYTVGNEIRKDRDATLKQIADIGYQQVQLATGLASDPIELLKSIRGVGLECSSAHYSLAELLKETSQKVELSKDSGMKSVFCSFPWVRNPERLNTKPGDQMAMVKALFESIDLDDWKWTAEQLNNIGRQMKSAGILFGYHNHNLDFRKFGQVTAIDELLRLTDPDLVSWELDCGWATVAGADPAALIAKHGKRIPFLHVKDQRPQDKPAWGVDGFARSTEVGNGIVNWKQVFEAAKKTGLKGYFVEQEPPFIKPPLESAAISYNYLLGLKG